MPTDHLHHGSISISTSVSVQCAVCSVPGGWVLGFWVLSHGRFGVGLVGSGKNLGRFDFGAVP
jgi:hypothetical protein